MTAVTVERRDPDVVVITMNRPEVLNAINGELLDGLWSAIDGLRHDSSCRAVILTGAGGAFCAGADLKTDEEAVAPGDEGKGMLGRIWGMQEYVTGVAVALHELRQPVIAAIDGVAVGGGFGFALASDLRVVSDGARLGAVFMNIGLSSLDVGVSYFLPRIVGAGRALEMMLTARIIDARAAQSMGLVSDVVAPEDLLPRALELAREITAHSEFSVWMTKAGFWGNLDAPSLRQAVDTEYRTQMLGVYHDNMSEAIDAFRNKRPPRWDRI